MCNFGHNYNVEIGYIPPISVSRSRVLNYLNRISIYLLLKYIKKLRLQLMTIKKNEKNRK